MSVRGPSLVGGAPAGRRGARLSAAYPTGALLLAVALTLPAALAAQAPPAGEVPALLARADSAFERGDSAAAARGYAAVLDADPANSRATYQRARLLPPGSPEAIRLFRRYTALEPDDAWGFIALGQSLLDAGAPADAVAAFAEAERIEPGTREAALGQARALAGALRTDAAIGALERWLARTPSDAAAWELLARERQRAGRAREAVRALERAHALAPDPAREERATSLRRLAAPALTPLVGGSRDSDGVRVLRAGLEADAAVADR
ncbi:MAG TPA: tetratricopeptide repeat protein, partial [Longimicrobiales bacterium]|nr:tetratricopeptide repeat protein [Longimicrobiales bacterium]